MDRRSFLCAATIAGTVSSQTQAVLADPAEEGIIQVRIARQTNRLQQIIVFYRDWLGLPVLAHFDNHAGYDGIMFGIPTARFHLEFTHAHAGSPSSATGEDDLLVLYIPNDRAYLTAVERLTRNNIERVEPTNPYWKQASITFLDPDGRRVVLYNGWAFGGTGTK